MREVLLIVPTYGHFDYVQHCLDSFARHTAYDRSHVLILDDASPDYPGYGLQTFCKKTSIRFITRCGVTRSWNEGLKFARDNGFRYTICGNSDLIFTEGWLPPLCAALSHGYDLVGPITNAPGHAPWQNCNNFLPFQPTDDQLKLDDYARSLQTQPAAQRANFINGFCTMASTQTWWNGAFDSDHVFDPSYVLTGNEDELQNRWRAKHKNIGYVPRSFVFHYRSVSRPDALMQTASNGAFRRG